MISPFRIEIYKLAKRNLVITDLNFLMFITRLDNWHLFTFICNFREFIEASLVSEYASPLRSQLEILLLVVFCLKSRISFHYGMP